MKNSEKVRAFHDAMGDDYPRQPTVPSPELLQLRATLIEEEYVEVSAAFADLRSRLRAGAQLGAEDVADLAHELVDLIYVSYGALAALGVPADHVFDAVHEANMAKLTGPRRADGKQLKPPGWRPADVRAVLVGAAEPT